METGNYILLFMSAFLGGMAIFIFKNNNTKNLKLILAFSGSYLFAITVLHLIPSVYQSNDVKIGLYVLLGFGLQILLEQFSEGIEHGHIHKHKHTHIAFPFGIIISLCLHAFLEGMPLIHSHDAHDAHDSLLYGIALHHIPAAFALGSVLTENQVQKKWIITMLFIFALMTPLGSMFSYQLQDGGLNNLTQWFSYIMATVIGMFLHISTTILFESSVDHRFNFYKMVMILLGTGIAILNLLF